MPDWERFGLVPVEVCVCEHPAPEHLHERGQCLASTPTQTWACDCHEYRQQGWDPGPLYQLCNDPDCPVAYAYTGTPHYHHHGTTVPSMSTEEPQPATPDPNQPQPQPDQPQPDQPDEDTGTEQPED